MSSRSRYMLEILFIDGLVLGGSALLALGARAIYRPLGLLVAGGLLLLLGLAGLRAKTYRDKPTSRKDKAQ